MNTDDTQRPADSPLAPSGLLGSVYRSACSGLWYYNPQAAGTVDAVRVGPKRRHLAIPDGADIVTGAMRPGDLVADIYDARWQQIDREDAGLDASIYDFVIRPRA